MNGRTLGLLALCLMALAAVFVIAGSVSATNDPPAGGGTVTGTWTVTDARTYTSVAITVNSGDIVIQNGASLTLNSVTLRVNPGTEGGYKIDVRPGGTLIVNGGTISGSPHYKFSLSGTATIEGAQISEMWGDTASWTAGIQIYSSSVYIGNSTIFNGKTGGVSIFNCNPVLYNATIRNNGQDGASMKYAFGLYGTGTAVNISYSNITNNTYSIFLEAPSTYIQPTSGYYWNGNYYYWSGSYYYRYDQIYGYSRGDFYGKGIYIEGGSAPEIRNNTIVKNGWGLGNIPYTYNNIWEDATHLLYYYRYIYYSGNRLVGTGIECINSNPEITGNFIDANGFAGASSASNQYTSVFWGYDINLTNSNGNITGNYIGNSSMLVNLISSSPNITGNRMFTDYGAGGASASFIPWRVGYGIRVETSKPYLYNNTVTLASQDTRWTTIYGTLYSMDAMVGIDLYKSPDVLLENNRIKLENRATGGVVGTGVNLTRATGVNFFNNTIEYKATGGGGALGDTLNGVMVSTLSAAYFDNNTFKGSASGSPRPMVALLRVALGAKATAVNSTFTGGDYGVYFTDCSSGTVTNLTIFGCQKSCIGAEDGSTLAVKACALSSSSRGITATRSKVTVIDTAMSDPTEFLLSDGSTVESYNSSFVRTGLMILDNASSLTVYWVISCSVIWQDETPATGVHTVVYDSTGAVIADRTTDGSGSFGMSVLTREFTARSTGTMRYTPHRVVLEKGRLNEYSLVILNASLDLRLKLVDPLGPDITIDYPGDGSLVNCSTVQLRGKAVDPESGFSTLELSVDGRDWSSVQLEAMSWNWNRTLSLPDGPHLIKVRAGDVVGNINTASVTIHVDTIGPVLTVISPSGGAYLNVRNLKVTGITEPGAMVTVNGKIVVLDNRFFEAYVSLTDGPNELSLAAADAVGNVRTVKVVVFYDAAAPLIAIEAPRDGQITNQNPVSVVGNTDPDTVTLTVNGYQIPLAGAGRFETSLFLYEGSNTIQVFARDRAGNTNVRTIVIVLDTAPPAISLSNPKDGLYTNVDRIQISGSSESDVTIRINGEITPLLDNLFSGFITLAEGPNQITVTARDRAQNRNTTVRTVYRDTRPPDLTITYPVEGSLLTANVVGVMGSVDHGSRVKVNGLPVTVTDFVFSTTIRFETDGRQSIEITATDLAGNSVTSVRRVVIDTSPPAVDIQVPNPSFKTKNSNLLVEGKTEPGAIVVINTETVTVAGPDGHFAASISLEDGPNRITVKATDKAGLSSTSSVDIIKSRPPVAVKNDTSWAMTLSGIFFGAGLMIPLGAQVAYARGKKHRRDVLASLSPLPTLQTVSVQEQIPVVHAFPADQLPPPPPADYYTQQMNAPTANIVAARPQAMPPPPEQQDQMTPVPFSGLQAKNTSMEVGAGDNDGFGIRRPQAQQPPASVLSQPVQAPVLKDKRYEAEHGAGETDQSGGIYGRKQ